MRGSGNGVLRQTRSRIWMTASALALFVASAPAEAGKTSHPGQAAGMAPSTTVATGIFTDRLTPRQLRIWKSIRNIVLARDRLDRPLYPTLNRLWHQAEACGHLIYIEISDRRCPICSSPAGSCTIERIDPAGLRHVLAIRLDLNMIDRAHIGELARRLDGFIPLRGLSKEERYAEVLGHELAHAVQIALDPDYVRLYQEMNRKAREYMDIGGFQQGRPEDQRLNIENRGLLERVAETTEKEIWRELTAGRHAGQKSRLCTDSVSCGIAPIPPGEILLAGRSDAPGNRPACIGILPVP